jgi:hypothetical protein
VTYNHLNNSSKDKEESMAGKYWYIKKRINTQLSAPYYKALGRISMREAKALERPLYGTNIITRFETEAEYLAECERLGIKENE